MKKNIVEIGIFEFIATLFVTLILIFEFGFFIGDIVGKSGEYERGSLNGYKQCMMDFNVTRVYNEIKRLSKEGN